MTEAPFPPAHGAGGAGEHFRNPSLTCVCGLQYRVIVCQGLKEPQGRSILDRSYILQMRKLRPWADKWLSQGHLWGRRSQDQATGFTFSTAWTIKSLQRAFYATWGCQPGCPSSCAQWHSGVVVGSCLHRGPTRADGDLEHRVSPCLLISSRGPATTIHVPQSPQGHRMRHVPPTPRMFQAKPIIYL